MTWFRSRLRDEEHMTGELVGAINAVTGARAQEVTFVSLAKGGGAIHGVVEVLDLDEFAAVLRVVAEVLGRDGGRVIIYLTGHTAEGNVVQPVDLGLYPRPNGNQVKAGLG